MPSFEKLVDLPGIQPKVKGRGCDFCPLDKVKGIHKIFGKVRGKEIFIWAQSPGGKENNERIELIGPAGELLWHELRKVGIKRKMCDIQNVVRCIPADRVKDEWPPLKMRSPSKEEIKCCSIYNERALQKSEAKLHLVFGKIAAQSLLGNEYRKDRRIFWSERLKATVALLDHPAYFLRGAPASRLKEFRATLEDAVKVLKSKVEGKYGYLKEQEYVGITSSKEAVKAYRDIKSLSRTRQRIAADLEEGVLSDSKGPEALVYGFSGKSGKSYVFPLGSYGRKLFGRRVTKKCTRIVSKILTDSAIKKVFQHGSYDVSRTKELLGIEVKGYDYDTQYAEYLAHVGKWSYALGKIVERRFPEFTGYKEIILPESLTPEFKKKYKKVIYDKHGNLKISMEKLHELSKKTKGATNLALLPWKKMVLYNGADCDVTKRIEVTTKKKVNLALVRVYKDAAFIMDKMEKDGPLFDFKQCEAVKKIFPVRAENILRRLRKLSHNKEFNPGSPKQVSEFLYKRLHLPILSKDGVPDTQKGTLARLEQYHKAPKLITQYRHDTKAGGTYVTGFELSAKLNGGKLRTIWRLTGTRTGRMSSGGKDSGEDGIVNLQNIHGDPNLQNLVISDIHWRKIYSYWKEHGDFKSDAQVLKLFGDYYIFLGFDHAQMELRVVAFKSGDKALIKIFSSGGDPHSLVGHELTGWPVEKIKNDEKVRRVVKNMQFGMVYGLTADSLIPYMRAKGVTEADASDGKIRRYHQKYFERFSGVKRMIDADRAFVEKHSYAQTLFGMKRPLEARDNEEGEDTTYWGNKAVNTPIQGTAHQLMLIGIVPLKRKPKKYKLLKRPQLEVHDAIYFRSKVKHLLAAIKLGKYMLEKESLKIVKKDFGINWTVPLVAEPKAGFRFGVQYKLDKTKGWDGTLKDLFNKWCAANQKVQRTLHKELEAVAAGKLYKPEHEKNN